jgi:hypothetical protein
MCLVNLTNHPFLDTSIPSSQSKISPDLQYLPPTKSLEQQPSSALYSSELSSASINSFDTLSLAAESSNAGLSQTTSVYTAPTQSLTSHPSEWQVTKHPKGLPPAARAIIIFSGVFVGTLIILRIIFVLLREKGTYDASSSEPEKPTQRHS